MTNASRRLPRSWSRAGVAASVMGRSDASKMAIAIISARADRACPSRASPRRSSKPNWALATYPSRWPRTCWSGTGRPVPVRSSSEAGGWAKGRWSRPGHATSGGARTRMRSRLRNKLMRGRGKRHVQVRGLAYQLRIKPDLFGACPPIQDRQVESHGKEEGRQRDHGRGPRLHRSSDRQAPLSLRPDDEAS